jgi:hypothetical protein
VKKAEIHIVGARKDTEGVGGDSDEGESRVNERGEGRKSCPGLEE